ncbi:DNA-deoxyinosine glycosylase [Solibacillus sp. FSL R7-0668]|uniref:DNA-deoxyinosine glycosylase n=1 Tax=Solibacillus sp. FSL R7-0668 TaxID=2921688 RepID=UPI0030FCCAB3
MSEYNKMQPIQNILPPIVDENTRVLVVGSMPSKQSLDKQQYYGNARNHFWPIIGELFHIEIPDSYEERIALLRANYIGLWDSIASCERKGSLDATIKNEVPNNFEALFQQYPQIQLVLFNGGKSFDVFKKHVGLQVLGNRAYEKMPSTSPIPGKNIKSFEEKVQVWQVLKAFR